MEEELKSLISRYLDNTLESEARVKLEVWLNQVHLSKEVVPDWSEEDRERNWDIILQQTADEFQQAESNNAQDRDRTTSNRSIWMPLLWSVSVAVTFVVAFIVVIWSHRDPVIPITTTAGKVILPDGTLVWLRDDSELTYPSAFAQEQREVYLKGAALFEVVRNETSPFVIMCDEYTARVLGTSFSIRSTPNDLEVVVLTGTVSIAPTGGTDLNHVTVLHHNERAVFSRGARVVESGKVAETDRKKIVANTSYDMQFEDTTMDSVAVRIASKFDVMVTFDNAGVKHCRISADFTDQTLQATLEMICEALGLSYRIDGNVVRLAGLPCGD